MKRLVMVPDGWPCSLGESRPGFFIWQDNLCFKDEYGSAGNSFNSAGEIFWGGVTTKEDRSRLVVQPVEPTWEEYDT
jgi:hypothetical protein